MTKNDYVHVPVLLDEVIESMVLEPDGVYVDCTYGRGGHSREILARLGDKGRLYVFDRDPEAIRSAAELCARDSRVQCFKSTFSAIGASLDELELQGKVDAFLFDLGISSPQIDNPARGFSFSLEGELDMRMDNTTGISAADWINSAAEEEISEILRTYGEEKFARRIARAITSARTTRPVSSTSELVDIITSAVPVREKHKHPATRSFQAIRIFVNNEIEELKFGLETAMQYLSSGGRLLVISFHSLEDRVVKRFFRKHAINDPYPIELPVTADMINPDLKIPGKTIYPGEVEINRNPRARSARLRVAIKTGK